MYNCNINKFIASAHILRQIQRNIVNTNDILNDNYSMLLNILPAIYLMFLFLS